jgi:hypothetical protein
MLEDDDYISVFANPIPLGRSDTFVRSDNLSKWMKVSPEDAPCFIFSITGLYHIHVNLLANGQHPSNGAYGFKNQNDEWVIRDSLLSFTFLNPEPFTGLKTQNLMGDWVVKIQGGTKLFLYVSWADPNQPYYLISRDESNIYAYRIM